MADLLRSQKQSHDANQLAGEAPHFGRRAAPARRRIADNTADTQHQARLSGGVATGVPTVALYGPTDPHLWGPWPVGGGLGRPWSAAGPIQQRGNVWLVQNPLPCLPCQLEGCERRLDSFSRCLDELTGAQVISAVD